MRFDASSKSLSEIFPAEWVAWLGWPNQRVEVIDADVATVSGAADKVFRVGADAPWLLLLEHLASYKGHIPERLHWHSTLIGHRHNLRVRSCLILLSPEADGPAMTGTYREGFPDEPPYLTFEYGVVRLWEQSPERLLAAGVGLAPLAPLGNVEPSRVPEIVHRARLRIEADCPARDAPELLAGMYILMGLRYDEGMIESIKREVATMEESITYQEILRKGKNEGKAEGKAEGRLDEARDVVLLFGANRLGTPDEATVRQINSIADLQQLHQLLVRAGQVNSWSELLATP